MTEQPVFRPVRQNPAYRTVAFFIMIKIISVIGARPQFIKAATISRIIRASEGISEKILHTGQHYDRNMSEVFFRELNIPEPDFNLNIGSGSHAMQTGNMMIGIEKILAEEKPDWVLLFGDTNSTIAGAVTAAKLHIPVAHVEAGLRSFNRMMPEEINRIVTDKISDILFAPTQTAVENLRHEGLEKNTRLTGDVMYDSVLFHQHIIKQNPEKYSIANLPEKYLLATIHRAENTDHPENLENILKAFGEAGYPVILPLHPRTAKTISQFTIPSNLTITEPVSYLKMLSITMNAFKVLTDSGGLQKEAYFLKIPCITLRTETEWVETLIDNWNIITATDPKKIIDAIHLPIPDRHPQPLFGNGNAAEIILHLLTGKMS